MRSSTGTASAGARLASFSIDAGLVVVVVSAVAGLTQSVALTAIAAAEGVVALVVWEARTGLTVGNAALGLRTACADRPWSPGACRELVRAGLVAAGALVGGVGAWFVVGTGGTDRTGRWRSWADRAARTVVVRVPDRAEQVDEPYPGLTAGGLSPVPAFVGPAVERAVLPAAAPGYPAQGYAAPGYVAQRPPVPASGPAPGARGPRRVGAPVVPGPAPVPGRAASPRQRRLMIGTPMSGNAPAPPVLPAGASRPAAPAPAPPPSGATPSAPGFGPPPSGVMPTAVSGEPGPWPALLQPGAPRSVAHPPRAGRTGPSASLVHPDVTVLLVFDTGERHQLPFGSAAVVGRDPSVQVAGDRLVAVRDDTGTVSKDHLRVEHTADGVWLTDLASTNGTRLLVDEAPVPLVPMVRTQLDGAVRIALGRRLVLVSYLVQGGRT